jgi:predicted RNase H-like HicB family nuclease
MSNVVASKYLIVVEKSRTGYSAYSPDILGCIATGKTIDKTLVNMKNALAMHLRGLLEDGEDIPQPRGIQSYLDAERDSAGEQYFITHIAVESVLPERELV